jgi:hypothetical protein
MAKSVCKNCGRPIISIDGWIHETTGRQECPADVQQPPLVAEPDTEGRYCA